MNPFRPNGPKLQSQALKKAVWVGRTTRPMPTPRYDTRSYYKSMFLLFDKYYQGVLLHLKIAMYKYNSSKFYNEY